MRDDDLILTTNCQPTLADFLEALGVRPTGLGAQLFTAVHNQFFVCSTDLRQEYEKYYCVEYLTLRDYLELAHEICLDSAALEKKYILKIKSPSGVVDRVYEDSSLDVVLDCLRKLEKACEDKDGLRVE